MKLRKFIDKYFNPALPLNIQAFNMLAIVGIGVGLLTAVANVITNSGVLPIVICLMSSVLAVALIVFTQKTGRYYAASRVTVALLFCVGFPVTFFTAGGYHSGMPSFFIFAILFTAILLPDGARGLWLGVEFVLYGALFAVAYSRPELVTRLPSEADTILDIIICFAVASIALLAANMLNIRSYKNQQSRLEANSQMKTQFLGNVSHEIRAPLTLIRSYAQDTDTILKGFPDQSAPDLVMLRDNMRWLLLAQERLLRMTEQLLDISALEEGGFKLRIQNVSLRDVTQDVELYFSTTVPQNDNTLTVDIPEDFPEILADFERTVQVFINLLSNANRHTRQGTITISARRSGATALVTVSDTGTGIAPETIGHLFERYPKDERVGLATGIGLGLYICKQYVEAQGGQISIDSTPGAGTAVTFTLPFAQEG
ncbi:MAG: HAMP domain-containing histidine kinase [Oscillospiraceae bacterium]|jgi:signal transduction histidine kinase|nr:HAMP domain-containing histidine kinase [Oscillospiraceae bacterium]